MENTMTTPEQIFTAKKMKMIYSILPTAYTDTLTQKRLDALLKTPLVKLENKLENIAIKYTMDVLRGKIQTEKIK